MLIDKYIVTLLFCVGIFLLGCQSSTTKSNANANTNELEYLPSGLPKSEKGITVVSENGWTKDQMDFQQRYCETMFENLSKEYDAIKFCLCFLDKVQYYYEPIYVREAYEDQKKWNSYCLGEAAL